MEGWPLRLQGGDNPGRCSGTRPKQGVGMATQNATRAHAGAVAARLCDPFPATRKGFLTGGGPRVLDLMSRRERTRESLSRTAPRGLTTSTHGEGGTLEWRLAERPAPLGALA